jgi:hypothetical protein
MTMGGYPGRKADIRGVAQVNPQSTYIYRVPQCMSPRRNWDSPTPSLVSECASPPETKGGGEHTRLQVRGWGSPNSDDFSAYSMGKSIQPTLQFFGFTGFLFLFTFLYIFSRFALLFLQCTRYILYTRQKSDEFIECTVFKPTGKNAG